MRPHLPHRPHRVSGTDPGRALIAGVTLTLGFAAVQVAASVVSGSLALASDAVHMLVDSAGLLLALFAALIARRPADLQRSYGYARVEVLVVPLHVLFMLALTGYIVYEAIGRLGADPEIHAVPVLIVGAVGLGVNLVVLRLLHGHATSNLNVRGAMFEVLADTLGSLGVIASAVVILSTGWTAIDIIVALGIAALVLPRAFALLRLSIGILLEATPPGIHAEAIEDDALAVPGVRALHDLHIWALAPSFVALSAHVEVESMEHCAEQIAGLTAMLRERHGITHVTLQPETHELHEAVACCEFPDAAESDHEHVRAGGAIV